jgi:hypothetical protein
MAWLFDSNVYMNMYGEKQCQELAEKWDTWVGGGSRNLTRQPTTQSGMLRELRRGVYLTDMKHEASFLKRLAKGVTPLKPLHWGWVLDGTKHGKLAATSQMLDASGCGYLFPFPQGESELMASSYCGAGGSLSPSMVRQRRNAVLTMQESFTLWVCTPTRAGWLAREAPPPTWPDSVAGVARPPTWAESGSRSHPWRGALDRNATLDVDVAPRSVEEWLGMDSLHGDSVELDLYFNTEHPHLRYKLQGDYTGAIPLGMRVELAADGGVEACTGGTRTAVLHPRFVCWLFTPRPV